MAIFGDLANMSAPEVLKMLGTKTGKLHIWPNPRKQFELHLHEGAVRCLKENGVSVNDKATLKRSLSELFGMRQGKFDFSQEAPSRLTYELDFTRQEVWRLLAGSELIPETEDENAAADQATRFKFSSLEHSELPENLQAFVQRGYGLLSNGCSAAELADALEMHVPLVQLYLMRLRSLDKVTPVRAYAPTYSYAAVTESVGQPETAVPLAAQPLPAQQEPQGPLAPPAPPSRIQPTLTNQAATKPPAAYQPKKPQPAARQVAAQPAQPKQTFVRRLLSVLSFGGR